MNNNLDLNKNRNNKNNNLRLQMINQMKKANNTGKNKEKLQKIIIIHNLNNPLRSN